MNWVLMQMRFDAMKRADEVKVGDALAAIRNTAFDPPFVVHQIVQTTICDLPAIQFWSERRPEGYRLISECAPHHMVEKAR